MILRQLLASDKSKITYELYNHATVTIHWAIYLKKIGSAAPAIRLTNVLTTDPEDQTPVQKPSFKPLYSRHLVYSTNRTKLTPCLEHEQWNQAASIWVDELNEIAVHEHGGLLKGHLTACPRLEFQTKQRIRVVEQKWSQSVEEWTLEFQGAIQKDLGSHPFTSRPAQVRCGKELSQFEIEFLAKKTPKVEAALSTFLNIPIKPGHAPRIAICSSGGGYRAMVSCLGTLDQFQRDGLLPCITYCAGLSGSTWAMANWYASGEQVSTVRSKMSDKMAKDFFTPKIWPGVVNQCVRERIAFGHSLSVTDLMGWHLTNHFLMDHPVDEWRNPRLSSQQMIVSQADVPMPIYTAVSYDETKYRWWEFTPQEVGSSDYNSWVPTWAFGRPFVDGKSTNGAVEPPLGLLLATFGSAFCATVEQIYVEATSNNDNEKLRRILSTLIYDKMKVANHRPVTPATYNNPMYSTKPTNEHDRYKTVRLMDAGIDFNLPMPPLLRPERQVDIIIALDYSASPEMDSGRALRLSEAFAREQKYPFPDCTEALAPDPARKGTALETDSKCANQLVTVLHGSPSHGIPTVIYLPLVANPSHGTFCARKCAAEGGYCSTFNFQYKTDQVLELSALTASIARDALPTIKKAILDHMASQQVNRA